ncbi:MAG: di-trans,poly-cis-decaprenylcistransferase [Nitrospirales bacterium]|nr:di-trans,poly-cis-decaprenylcistransferase [Nitrospirales bacterium]
MNHSSSDHVLHLSDDQLLRQLDPDQRPRHIAFIMDGNGRWAKFKHLPRIAGHRQGLLALRDILGTCHELDIPIVTIYAFSYENWNRPEYETTQLMALLEEYLEHERARFQEYKTRFLPIGRLDSLPASIQSLLQTVKEETQHFTQHTLTVALSYGGRSEIIDAINHLITDVQNGVLLNQPVNETLFQQYLATANVPDPDLLIRTSGENRLSNFLLWQIAYTELYFTKTFWPDFRRRELILALLDYQTRERRFGGLSHAVTH